MRKWWFKYVAHIPEPSGPAQQIGTQLHGEIERFLKTGENGLGKIALSGREHIDEVRNENVRLVEHRFDGELHAESIPLIGYIDVVLPTRAQILDWKTTSDIAAYAKTPAELQRSTQMVGYGKWFLGRYDFDAVILTHVYFQTRGASRSHKSSCIATDSVIETEWLNVERVVRSMVDVAKTPVEQVEGVHDRKCFRCPYRSICPTPASGTEMSLLDIFENFVPKPPLSAPPQGPVAPDTDPAPVVMQGPETPVNAPEPKNDIVVEKSNVVAPENPEPLEVPAPNESKKTRGRPKGSKNTPKEETPEQAPVDAKPESKPEAPPEQQEEGFSLFVNCIATGMFFPEDGAPYVRSLCSRLEEAFGCVDLRVPPSDPAKAAKYADAMGFGKWKGALSALARQSPPTGFIRFCYGPTDEVTAAVVEALRPLADVIVEPLR